MSTEAPIPVSQLGREREFLYDATVPLVNRSLLDYVSIVDTREGGMAEAFVPLSLIYREDVPVDAAHVNELADSIIKEEEHGRVSGQLSPVLLGEVSTEPQFRILDGFHRVGALTQLNRIEAFATIRPNCTPEDVVDLRIISATTHRSVRFIRVLDWVEDAWKLTGWSERVRLTQAFALRFSGAMTGSRIGLDNEEADEVKQWVNRKCDQWHISPAYVYKHLQTAQAADPQLIREARGRGGGHKLEALTPDHLHGIALALPQKFDLQNLVAEEAIRKSLTVPRARALAEAVSTADTLDEARNIMASINFNLADQAIRKQVGSRPEALRKVTHPEEDATYERTVFLHYYDSVQTRAQNTGRNIFEIIGQDFAQEAANHASISNGTQNGKEHGEDEAPLSFSTPYGELLYFRNRGLAVSPLQPKGTFVELTPTEGRILEQLLGRPSMVHSARILCEFTELADDVLLKTHVSHVRSKLGDIIKGKGTTHKLIFNIPSRGYTLVPHSDLE